MRVAALVVVAAVAVLGCAHSPFSRVTPETGPDSLYWRALAHLDAANKQGSADSALKLLDAYLTAPIVQKHRAEAFTIRRLARDAQQLARVEAALQQARAEPPRVRSDTTTKARDDEALKEIQRLKDELAKANEELERIRKRLANPKPPL